MKEENYRKLPTPAFLLDRAAFLRSARAFLTAMELNHGGEVRLGYSVKTNSHPLVIQAVKDIGMLAEVVSADEYRLVRSLGFSPSKIIYNGPLKDHDTFVEALNCGAVVNIETWREIDWLRDARPRGVGLRIAVNLSEISPKDAIRTNDQSRFGFIDEQGEVTEAILRIRAIPGMSVSGLHLHRNTDARRVSFYSALARYAVKIAARHNLTLDYLDIGGGYHFNGPGKPSFSDYFKAVNEALEGTEIAKATLLAEPGNALSATIFQYITEVIDVKDSRVIVDGTRNDIDPLYHRMDYDRRILLDEPAEERPIVPVQTIGGCTCMERDVLFTLRDAPALRPGDRIVFRNAGAYTMALAPAFIRRPAQIIPIS